MTELMKRYNHMTLHDAEVLLEELENLFYGHNDKLVDRISELKNFVVDSLTWLPVSEKPEKKTGQILCKRQVKVNSKEFTRLYPADMCDIEDWAHFVKKLEIVSYLPIPPAPEGAHHD